MTIKLQSEKNGEIVRRKQTTRRFGGFGNYTAAAVNMDYIDDSRALALMRAANQILPCSTNRAEKGETFCNLSSQLTSTDSIVDSQVRSLLGFFFCFITDDCAIYMRSLDFGRSNLCELRILTLNATTARQRKVHESCTNQGHYMKYSCIFSSHFHRLYIINYVKACTNICVYMRSSATVSVIVVCNT